MTSSWYTKCRLQNYGSTWIRRRLLHQMHNPINPKFLELDSRAPSHPMFDLWVLIVELFDSLLVPLFYYLLDTSVPLCQCLLIHLWGDRGRLAKIDFLELC